MPLTNIFCKNVQPLDKNKKYSDSHGLYLEVSNKGSKYWRYKYRFNNKEKRLAIGVYPNIKLKEARIKRDEAKIILSQGIDPSAHKQQIKKENEIKYNNLFKNIAMEWYETKLSYWSDKYAKSILSRLNNNLLNEIGNIPIDNITAPILLSVLKKIENRGALEQVAKVRQICSLIFTYAIATGYIRYDITIGLKGALKTHKVNHYKYFKENELPEFVNKLEQYDGYVITKLAIKFILHTFVRTSELREAKWEEFNFDKNEWHIPAERMKMNEKHIVPLTQPILEIISEIKSINHNSLYLFPNINNRNKTMSITTMLYALYRLGYHSRATIHGFRATASTILNEYGFRSDIIERQLAHAERNSVRASYNHAEYLKERKNMMSWWSDFILKQYKK